MKAGQITAKLRDAVPVEFYEDGSEKAWYKNIDIPDSLKDLDIMDFGFDVSAEGKITFRLFFENGTLPAEFPPIREKFTRAKKAAMKAAQAEMVHTEDLAVATAEVIEAATGNEVTVEATDASEPADVSEQPERMVARFNVTGDRRKELVTAVGGIIGWEPVYKGAPSFAFAVGNYLIDKTGTLTGEPNPELLAALAEQSFTSEENSAT